MARHPDSIQKINYVTKFLMDTCDAPYSVYITTLWPALMEALVAWYALDMVQIFTGWVRPNAALKGFRGGRHRPAVTLDDVEGKGRKPNRGSKRTWVKKWGRWVGFDPWDELGKRLPFAEALSARSLSPNVATLWNIYELEQRAMFWVQVYEITTEFFYKWASGVAQSWYCQQQYTPWVLAERATIGDPGVPGGAGILLPEPTKARFGGTSGNLIQVYSQGSDLHVQAIRSDASNGRLYRLKAISGDGEVFVSNEVADVNQAMVLHATSPFNGSWYLIFEANGTGAAHKLEASCIGTAMGNNPYNFPPTWDQKTWLG